MLIKNIFFFLFSFQFFNSAESQVWSEPFRFQGNEKLQFRWRNIGLIKSENRYMIEFEFVNNFDSTVVFNYQIFTNYQEERWGRIMLQPRQHKLSGWIFEGDVIQQIYYHDVFFFKEQF